MLSQLFSIFWLPRHHDAVSALALGQPSGLPTACSTTSCQLQSDPAKCKWVIFSREHHDLDHGWSKTRTIQKLSCKQFPVMDRCPEVAPCLVCKESIGNEHDLVRVAVPSKVLKKMSASYRQKLAFAWSEHSVPYFHKNCWEKIEKQANCRIKKGSEVSLSVGDRSIVLEVEETAEFFETLDSLQKKAEQIAKMMKNSSHTVVFTGAGISASAGIPTYRGADGIDVVAKLGGKVESDKPSQSSKATGSKKRKQKEEDDPNIQASEDYLKLVPTSAHRLISKWMNDKLVHFVITQNCDDLHGRSGVPRESMCELHGNVFIEFCEKCHTEYRRPYCVDLFSTDCHQEDWYVKCPTCHFNHYTGRACSAGGCQGRLRDTIVNFGDDLHASVLGGLARAEAECGRAGVALCVGSSLTVTPAAELPAMLPAGGALVVVNLQRTGLDADAAVRVWGAADVVLEAVQRALQLPPAECAAGAGGNAAGAVEVSAGAQMRIAGRASAHTKKDETGAASDKEAVAGGAGGERKGRGRKG